MKDRMIELGIKMTELSQYMKISRPTLYKYLELYESKEYGQIPEKILRSFKELDRRRKMTKEQFIAFVIGEFDVADDSDNREIVRRYVSKCSPSDPKLELMCCIVGMSQYGELIPYLSNCIRILTNGPKDDAEIYQVVRFMQLREQITKNVPVTREEIEVVKTLLEDWK